MYYVENLCYINFHCAMSCNAQHHRILLYKYGAIKIIPQLTFTFIIIICRNAQNSVTVLPTSF